MNENYDESLNTESTHENKSEDTAKSQFLSEYFDNAETILNQLKTMTLGSILFKDEQNFQLTTKYEKCLLNNYKNRMGLYISCLFDPQFDIFTPPRKGFLDDYDICLFFEFYDPQFKIISKSSNGISAIDIGYELNALPILECLETGTVSRELFCLLDKMKFSNWDNGVILSKCTDFRLQPHKEFLLQLIAGPELIDHFSNTIFSTEQIREKLEFEKQALLIQNQKICSDPSQDIARIYSDIDWRKKMWKNHENVQKSTMTRRNTQVPTKVTKVTPIDISAQSNLESFQKDFDSIFQNYQV